MSLIFLHVSRQKRTETTKTKEVIPTTPRKEKALQALLVSRTRAEAAKAAGIGESTLREYLKDPEFLERYREAFGNLVQDATRQAQQALALAISTLTEIMGNTDEQATARIQAARSTLEYAMRLTEQSDILEQIRELEKWRDETDGKH